MKAFGFQDRSQQCACAPAAAGLLLAGVLLTGCPGKPPGPLNVDPITYEKMVSAFYAGTLAARVEDNEHTHFLLEASRLVPDEPAPWANLALMKLRNRDAAGARRDLQRAAHLSGPDSAIEHLWAILYEQLGKPDDAMKHLRRAVELDPKNIRARYDLIQAIIRQSGGDNDETERHWHEIVRHSPLNLAARIELLRTAQRGGDAGAYREALAALKPFSAAWDEDLRKRFAELEAVPESGLAAAAGITAMFANVLQHSAAYEQGAGELGKGSSKPGSYLEHFLRLPSPSPNPGPPDTGLTYAAESIGQAGARWATALMLSPAPPPKELEPPEPDGPWTLLVADAASVRLRTPPDAPSGPRLPLPGAAGPQGVLAIDWNNDHKPDLALAGPSGLRLFQQSSPQTWTDVTARTKLPPTVLNGRYTGVWTSDVDQEGDLDLVLGVGSGPPPVLRNNMDGTWTVIHPFPGLDGLRAFAVGDFDGDFDADAAAVDGKGRLVILENHRAGDYRPANGPAVTGPVTFLAAAEVTGDGVMDLTLLASAGSVQAASRPSGEGEWDLREIASWPGVPADGGRLSWADLDNNGAVDLVVCGSKGTGIWLGDGRGGFQAPSALPEGCASTPSDLNDDGLPDLVGVSPEGKPVRWIGKGTRGYHWIVLRPRNDPKVRAPDKTGNQKLNPFLVDGEVEVRAGLLVQKQPIAGPWIHFGLGERPRAEIIRFLLPNGQPQAEFDLNPDRAVMVRQRTTGSCPWLFAFNGARVEFVTDILWKSPLGLKINAQETAGAQTRDWVKVRADQLRPRDGHYDLRITAELWETNFFDHVALMTVDHPQGTEVFVDERFAIPQPPLALHVTGPVVPIAGATDDLGADVTDLLRTRDGRHVDSFGLGRYQGITRDHFLEIRLPDSTTETRRTRREAVSYQPSAISAQRPTPNTPQRPTRLNAQHPTPNTPQRPTHPHTLTPSHPHTQTYLVAYGWVFPTDSSINVAISQGRHARPQGLSLEVPDGRGGWKPERRDLGFPAGKNKTVLIPLPEGVDRVRLRTNLEIYWDYVGVATRSTGILPVTRLIPPDTAELSYRGFSRLRQPRRSTPELPDYNGLSHTGQVWPDLIGFYTRFGDVRELLATVDDRYVIMNAGDEIALRFPAPPPPPPNGWMRDFVFVSDGWDKDGNLNTTFSKTVLPLPSHGNTDYDTPPGRLEDDPVYRRHAGDWESFHTRWVTPYRFRTALRGGLDN